MKLFPTSFVTTALVALAGAPFVVAEPAFIGADKCKKCHIAQFKSWEQTKMAKAFELLKPGAAADAKKAAGLDGAKDYTADAACVGCHTTGQGKPGGFVDVATTPGLLGVQCEACHGPGGSYVADDKMSLKNKEYKRADLVPLGLVSPPTEQQCVGCHNDKSPFFKAFVFAERKGEGTHEHKPLKYQH